MPVLNRVVDFFEQIIPGDYDNHLHFRLYECNYCNFEVLDGGKWYKVDASHPWSKLYEDEDVTEDIAIRLEKAAGVAWNSWQVPKDEYVKHYEDLLRAEFDDVRFLGTDYIPGAVY